MPFSRRNAEVEPTCPASMNVCKSRSLSMSKARLASGITFSREPDSVAKNLCREKLFTPNAGAMRVDEDRNKPLVPSLAASGTM